MQFVSCLLKREPPGPLFHYTTQQGLLGIVHNRSIWASSSRYLNDVTEFELAKGLAEIFKEKKREVESSQERINLLGGMREAARRAGINVCVCSFSEAGDLLSQWRAYSGHGTGYSLGFDHTKLRTLADARDYILVPCLYDRPAQVEFCEAMVSQVWDENIEHLRKSGKLDSFLVRGGNLRYYLNRFALVIKDAAFAEEKEWRLISKPKSYSDQGMSFRSGRSTIVPYDVFPLADDNGDAAMPLVNIVVGPTPHPEDAAEALRGLLANKYPPDVEVCDVFSSRVPFRNW